MMKKIFAGFVFLLTCLSGNAQQENEISIGVLTDVQYCNCVPVGVRYYRLSLAKLDSAIDVLNKLPLKAVFHLGDMTDRYASSMDSILPRFGKFQAPVNYVLGNHEYLIEKEMRSQVQKRIGLKETYYTYDLGQWRMIILDGNDLSFFAPQTKQQRKERNQMVASLYEHFRFNGLPWNGGIGSVQMEWLKKQLDEADRENKNVIVMCHFPLIAPQNHTLFNNMAMLKLLTEHPSVKAYFCGHYHDGGYVEYNGIHLVNFRGMVNTQQNAFSEVVLKSDSIIIHGYGREPSRKLKIR